MVEPCLDLRDLARLAETRWASPEDVELALENLTDIYDYLVAERAPP